MYDLLTREQLHILHELLFLIGQGLYAKMFTEDDQPAMPPSSDEWQRLHAAQKENSAAMRAVFAEIERRDTVEDAVITQSIFRGLGGSGA